MKLELLLVISTAFSFKCKPKKTSEYSPISAPAAQVHAAPVYTPVHSSQPSVVTASAPSDGILPIINSAILDKFAAITSINDKSFANSPLANPHMSIQGSAYPSSPLKYTNQVYEHGTSDYFSDCSYTQPATEFPDPTPSQREIIAKTDVTKGSLPASWQFKETGNDYATIDWFCSANAIGNHPFYDQEPRNTILSRPPKCDPTLPNSPGSREMFMQMVNAWRDIAGLNHLVWDECLSQGCNRPGSGHEGFATNKCTPKKCGGGLAEAAFGSACDWNWWRRLSIPMCAFFGDAHRGIFLNPNAVSIGYYQLIDTTENPGAPFGPSCRWGYKFLVDVC